MTSYQIDIANCPGCKAKLAVLDLASCNTFGATFYTDGYVFGPMYDERGNLLACPACGTEFWRQDMSVSSSLGESEFLRSADNRALPFADTLGLASYPALVKRKFWRTTDEEKYIRIRAWWAWNGHCLLDAEASELSFPHPATANCERLLEILVDTDDDETIMRAEIYREIGRFQESITQLDRPYPDRFARVVSVIRRLAREEKRSVTRIE